MEWGTNANCEVYIRTITICYHRAHWFLYCCFYSGTVLVFCFSFSLCKGCMSISIIKTISKSYCNSVINFAPFCAEKKDVQVAGAKRYNFWLTVTVNYEQINFLHLKGVFPLTFPDSFSKRPSNVNATQMQKNNVILSAFFFALFWVLYYTLYSNVALQ